jgi:glycosyltransferase involved in cell wall biosynthesis
MLTILTLKMLLMIVYLAHWDWILTRSRKDIVSNINNSKFMAICPINENEIELESYYQEIIDWKIDRNKIFDFWGIKNLRKIIKNLNSEDIVHVFTLKSGLLFAFANLFRNNKTKNILTITGLGYLFSDSFKAKILKILLSFFITHLINKNFDFLMYQNIEDQKTFNNYSKYIGESYIIPTSGITVKELQIKKEYRNSNLKIIMATRLINDKGIFEYLELANLMKDSDFKFYLAGDVDKGNPDSLSKSQLDEIKNNKYINYLGHIDIKRDLHNYDINIVMSKYEGSSRILLESLYIGLICLSNNIPGTIELGSKFSNSFFIDDNNIREFKEKLNEIINYDVFLDDSQNSFFGKGAEYNRELINKNYTSVKIATAYNKIYQFLREEIESYKSEFI